VCVCVWGYVGLSGGIHCGGKNGDILWWLIMNAFVHRVGASDFRLVVMSLYITMHAKRRVVVRRVVAMSHCRSVQIEGLACESSDRATSRRTKTRLLACFARDRTTRR
jgi:hypothetical protein